MCAKPMVEDEPKYEFNFKKFYKFQGTINGDLKDCVGASYELICCDACMKKYQAWELVKKAMLFNKMIRKRNIQKDVATKDALDGQIW